LSGVDIDERPAWKAGLVEISNAPSKEDCSSSSAGPFVVLPAMSRIGRGEGREESEGWRKARLSPALVVAARTVYPGDPVFDNNEMVPVNELEGSVRLV
jgi:hypothetical protein